MVNLDLLPHTKEQDYVKKLRFYLPGTTTNIYTSLNVQYSNNNGIHHRKGKKLPTLEVDRDTSYLIGITLTSFIVLYFINYFYISVKIDKRLYILILSMMLLIVEVLLLRQIEDIETFTKNNSA